ncbi:MAG: sigma-54 dependent transcriptional regulator, partial [Candidatus Cloacimonetes bacterium]|nr:sigma-54 dependent transcriptional regulator [Candidatus Cloacimonadota bacterium]
MKKNILIVDDEKDTLSIFNRFLENSYNVFTAPDIESAEITLGKENIDCIVSDLIIPGCDGLGFVKKLRNNFSDIPVLVMSGKATVKMAVEAMREGAHDFIEKPILNFDILPVLIDKALKSREIIAENILLRQKLENKFSKSEFIGVSQKIQKIFNIVRKISNLNTTILVQGQTGTGKELLANLIHNNSQRKDKPFVPVNCGAVPETLLESLLFGHVKGTFTGADKDKQGLFEEANGGTLFLDEIGDTSTAFQIKLLRVLQEKKIRRVGGNQEKEIDVRIIAATNRNLEEEVKKNNFRKDLFYRLNVIKIELPSLNERIEDIPLLANHFLRNFMKENEVTDYKISREVMDIMKKVKWEGNIRELQNVIEYSAALCSDKMIKEEDLPDYLKTRHESISQIDMSSDYSSAKTYFETIYFRKLMQTSNGKMNTAAEISGL